MTAPEWAVEKAARGLHEHDYRPTPTPWGDLDHEVRDEYRRAARAALDAVWPEAVATTTEWGVRPKWGAPVGGDGVVPRDEETARRLLFKNPTFWTLVQRDVTRSEWREVPL